MKLQFEPGRVRLRRSGAEFGRLRSGEKLATALAWPGAQWRLELSGGKSLAVGHGRDGVELTVPAEDLADLERRLPARDGLVYRVAGPDGGALEMRLEVDLHDGRRRPR